MDFLELRVCRDYLGKSTAVEICSREARFGFARDWCIAILPLALTANGEASLALSQAAASRRTP